MEQSFDTAANHESELRRKLLELNAKDVVRLDWLEANADWSTTSCGETWWTVNGVTRAMLRDAIDAAMEAE